MDAKATADTDEYLTICLPRDTILILRLLINSTMKSIPTRGLVYSKLASALEVLDGPEKRNDANFVGGLPEVEHDNIRILNRRAD